MTSERRNITQPADWWAAFEKAAQVRGETLSEWVGAACLQCLTREQRRKLTDRSPRGRRWETSVEPPAMPEGNPQIRKLHKRNRK